MPRDLWPVRRLAEFDDPPGSFRWTPLLGDYRVVEDANFLVRALVRGVRMAYVTDVHVIYRIHDGNSSASASG